MSALVYECVFPSEHQNLRPGARTCYLLPVTLTKHVVEISSQSYSYWTHCWFLLGATTNVDAPFLSFKTLKSLKLGTMKQDVSFLCALALVKK